MVDASRTCQTGITSVISSQKDVLGVLVGTVKASPIHRLHPLLTSLALNCCLLPQVPLLFCLLSGPIAVSPLSTQRQVNYKPISSQLVFDISCEDVDKRLLIPDRRPMTDHRNDATPL